MSDIPRLSYDKNLLDKPEVVNCPQGLPFLPTAEPAPATRQTRKQNQVIEGQAGHIGQPLPTQASAAQEYNVDGSVRGGLSDAKRTEGGKQSRAKKSS